MKMIMMAAVATVALSAVPASAQSTVSQVADFDVTGTVVASCGAIVGSTSDLAFGDLNITPTGMLSDTRSALHEQETYCNGAGAKIKVDVTPMTTEYDGPLVPPGFTNTINYTATVTLDGVTIGTDGNDQTVGAFAGDLVVQASALDTGGDRPVAGDYAGLIKVTLSPIL